MVSAEDGSTSMTRGGERVVVGSLISVEWLIDRQEEFLFLLASGAIFFCRFLFCVGVARVQSAMARSGQRVSNQRQVRVAL